MLLNSIDLCWIDPNVYGDDVHEDGVVGVYVRSNDKRQLAVFSCDGGQNARRLRDAIREYASKLRHVHRRKENAEDKYREPVTSEPSDTDAGQDRKPIMKEKAKPFPSRFADSRVQLVYEFLVNNHQSGGTGGTELGRLAWSAVRIVEILNRHPSPAVEDSAAMACVTEERLTRIEARLNVLMNHMRYGTPIPKDTV